jgi:hypothetical protein
MDRVQAYVEKNSYAAKSNNMCVRYYTLQRESWPGGVEQRLQ